VSLWAASAPPDLEALAYRSGETTPETQEPIVPLPSAIDQNPAKVALGERLFQDVRLSRDNTLSCATCHQLAEGGDDAVPHSMGAQGDALARNAPTVFNVAFNAFFNWDGGAPSLEVQAERVLLNPKVMNNTWPELIGKLRADPDYPAAFRALYPEGLSSASLIDALVSFEQSLVTPNARFDRYLRGEHRALGADELKGYELFKSYGCAACHQGINVGGNLFQKFGVFQDPDEPRSPAERIDLGRFEVTQLAHDREVFRVPSLRNVALTAPYFHDGRAHTLKEAVATMARVQLGRRLSPQEVDLIVRFLHTLTGEFRGRPLAALAQEAP
jgi:cytochrome c peroxidase